MLASFATILLTPLSTALAHFAGDFACVVLSTYELSKLWKQTTTTSNRGPMQPGNWVYPLYKNARQQKRQLAYGMPADAVDEYIRIAESTATKSLLRFCAAVIDVFSGEYLREPNSEDIRRLAKMHEERGFVGMLGSLDCMHWAWKKCPTAWAGQYTGKEEEPTIVLEAVVSRDLWFWHAFFGMPGSHNDITVLKRSDLFSSFANAEAPRCSYTINGNTYVMGYFLADGIYPAWATLVQTIPVPRDNKEKYYAQKQEGARKDVERGFSVLQAQFAIVQGPGRFWSPAIAQKTLIFLQPSEIWNEESKLYWCSASRYLS